MVFAPHGHTPGLLFVTICLLKRWWERWCTDQTPVCEVGNEVPETGFLWAWGNQGRPWRGGTDASRSTVRLQSTPGTCLVVTHSTMKNISVYYQRTIHAPFHVVVRTCQGTWHSSLHAVCRWVRRGHHASLPGAQGEGVHVPDTTAEAAPSSAAAQTRCQGLRSEEQFLYGRLYAIISSSPQWHSMICWLCFFSFCCEK